MEIKNLMIIAVGAIIMALVLAFGQGTVVPAVEGLVAAILGGGGGGAGGAAEGAIGGITGINGPIN